MITKETVLKIINKRELVYGMQKYKYIMSKVSVTDVAKDIEFQKVYRDFYQMTNRFYSDEFAKQYFEIMEELKTQQSVSFAIAFEKIKRIQNTFEVSFSSKMVHTLDANMPIWDSVVTTQHFGISAPSYHKDKERKTVEKYNMYKKKYYEYLKSDEGQMLIRLFDEMFPQSGITDVKKIDFILWQDR